MVYNGLIINMKRKLLLMGISFSLVFLMTGCYEAASFSRGFIDGYDAANNGYTLIGGSTSSSACSSACLSRGYKYYRYNSSTELCYCK